ncbi:type II toxin-antitoxin system RelE family toxin [Candidatus Venteria ishoeyi]|uniref:Plasmid stabilisation system protein n=1 Tax=Candidatus Venteria ishoeyi TaxID=1899563 RepID=A0A1H6FA52_9GAMM|nr:type II toxin-antitoxin system RelE/ParE family toxin [Candidatus Venteria ishoeyi]SEH06179.1 Plasmid stabilisation system protein [Candidatus Venteria ishoeyi]
MYQIRILDEATNELSRLDKTVAKQIAKRITWLAENFDNIRPEPLSANLAGFYKLRVGDYRVVYEVFDTERCLIIHKIGHRREVYR